MAGATASNKLLKFLLRCHSLD